MPCLLISLGANGIGPDSHIYNGTFIVTDTCFAHSSTFSNKQLFTMDSKLLVSSECGESAIHRVHIRGWQRTHNPFCAGPQRRQQPDEGRRK